MGQHNPLDGSEELLVLNETHAEHFDDARKYARGLVGDTRHFEKNDAFVFTPEEFRLFAQRAGVIEAKRTSSQHRNISWVWLRKAVTLPKSALQHLPPACDTCTATVSAKYSAQRHCGHSSVEKFSEIIRRTLLPILQRDITFSVPHKESAAYASDGPFQIYVWSYPAGFTSKTVDAPLRVWNLPVACRDDWLIPKESFFGRIMGVGKKSVTITDGQYTVATLFPNALYIHHDIVHIGSEKELELFAVLLMKAAALIASPDEWKQLEERIAAAKADAEKQAFRDIIVASVTARATRNETAIKAAIKKARDLREQYFAAERELFTLEQMGQDPIVAQQKFIAEFEKLQQGKVPGVLGITIDPDDSEHLVIHFDDIIVDHPIRRGVRHHLGKYDSTLNLSNGSIKIVNVTYGAKVQRDDGTRFHSPHIFETYGRVCLGNIGGEMTAYIAHYELEAAATLIHAFLQSVTTVDRGHGYVDRLEHYPRVAADGTIPANAA
jgi:hypothetical protein